MTNPLTMQPYRIVSGEDPIFQARQHIAFFGRSNVGKSSTINALLGSRAAKTSNRPGKTVTFNFYEWDQDTFLVDLPGYGFARGGAAQIEKLRRRLLWYLQASGAEITYFVLVLDAKAGLTEADKSAVAIACEQKLEVMVLINKIDRLNQSERHQVQKRVEAELAGLVERERIFLISARTKRGIDTVKAVFGAD